MIPNIAAACQEHRPDAQANAPWQQALAQAIRDPDELLKYLALSAGQFAHGILHPTRFPLRVPRGYAARMRKGDARDPLLLQVLTQGQENLPTAGYGPDPVGDDAATVSPGLLHKYHGRVLLVTTGACPVHCRYCFRRHFPYGDNHLQGQAWQDALAYIAADSSIHEVILSGGDPLSLGNARLARLSQDLSRIRHLRRLRIHSRMPVVLPERIDAGLLDWLQALPWQTVMVIHCNHAHEIDAGVADKLAQLKQAGVTLLNQAVLLRDINDSVAAQVALNETLFSAGVLPYYLHQLDRVAGAAHFEVSDQQAQHLMQALRQQLPGYLMPQLVRELAGEAHKTPLGPSS